MDCTAVVVLTEESAGSSAVVDLFGGMKLLWLP
jgi:hypothetical protein